MKKQYAFYFDSSSCSGCKTCQIACKDKNSLGLGIRWRRVYEIANGGWTNKNGTWFNDVKSYNVSMACNHCENPVCAKACPTKALNKNKKGIVSIDSEKCIGCQYCSWVCPYGAPQYDENQGIMTKCDLCSDYLEDGKNPSCVDACPVRVLDFGELKYLEKKYGTSTSIYPLPLENITEPAIVITPHKGASSTDDKNAEIINKEEV